MLAIGFTYLPFYQVTFDGLLEMSFRYGDENLADRLLCWHEDHTYGIGCKGFLPALE